MFTGLVEAVGQVRAIEPRGGDMVIAIDVSGLEVTGIALGDSISVSGVCLTVIKIQGAQVWMDVSRETTNCTNFNQLTVGAPVNLEQAVTPTTRLGGHLVSGHVDGVGSVEFIKEDVRSVRIGIRVPKSLAKYIAMKGSICVDGVSLTVNHVEKDLFDVNIIPHTMDKTTLKFYSVGRAVNIEVDVVARYLERLLTAGRDDDQEKTPITKAFLMQNGFASE
jgi:riboflavin synthase